MAQGVVWGSPVVAKPSDTNTLSYGELFKEVDRGTVTKVELDPATKVAKVTVTGGSPDNKVRNKDVLLLEDNSELFNKLNSKGVEISVQRSADKNAIFWTARKCPYY